MFVYYTSKILFVLYDNCDDRYSFYLFLRVLVTMLPVSYVYENTIHHYNRKILCGIFCKLNRKILFNPLPTCICNHIPHLLKCYINGTKIIDIFWSGHFFRGCYYRGGDYLFGGVLLSGFNNKVKKMNVKQSNQSINQ